MAAKMAPTRDVDLNGILYQTVNFSERAASQHNQVAIACIRFNAGLNTMLSAVREQTLTNIEAVSGGRNVS